jgi:uncharacterized damage-inducible protein DinB
MHPLEPLADRFRRWYAYECDAHEKVWASFDSVPPENRHSEAFQQSLDLFAHMLTARELWLHRFGHLSEAPVSLTRSGVTRRELQTQIERIETLWQRYLDRLDGKELERIFRYRSTEGDHYSNAVEEILAQLFGHSSYHRGQIAMLIKHCGGTPAVTDYVFWCRRPISA